MYFCSSHLYLLMSVRKINDGMSIYFSQRILKLLNEKNINFNHSKILLLGLSFKENCPDIRNSKIIDLINELKSFNVLLDVFDPIVNSGEVKKEFGLNVLTQPKRGKYDLVIIAVSHQFFKELGIEKIRSWCKKDGSIMDLKSTFHQNLVDYTV